MTHVSPRLEFCPATLPATAYFDADWYGRKMGSVFARNWICVGRLADFAAGTMRRVQVGAADVIVCRAADGGVGVAQHLSGIAGRNCAARRWSRWAS